MVSINLLESCFRPNIHCATPAVDGYEVENLLGRDEDPLSFRQTGFLAESFIKPPVDIKLTFPCNINLDKILLNTKIGAQYSTGIEIYSHSSKINFDKYNSSLSEHGETNKDETDTRVFSAIGRGRQSGHLFCFKNNRFNQYFTPKRSVRDTQVNLRIHVSNSSDSEIATFELTDRFHERLARITHLTIRITSAARGGVCAIRRLEIWGYPSKCVPNSFIHMLMQSQCDTSRNVVADNDVTSSSSYVQTKVEANRDDSPQTVVNHSQTNASPIPSDFLDALTAEMMLIPMLLPSGHNIDQSSLERHNIEQAKWGRVPSDPFTFKAFTGDSQPIVNVALKVRIDEFLFKNPQVEFTKRTLGRENLYETPVVRSSHLLDNDASVAARKLSNWDSNKSGAQHKQAPKRSNALLHSRNSSHECSTKVRKLETPQKVSSHTCDTKLNCGSNSKITQNPGFDNAGVNERSKAITSSLDNALSTVLGNLPSFSQALSSKENQQEIDSKGEGSSNICVFCTSDAVEMMYKLSCDHLICRLCLTKLCSASVVCRLCNVMSQKKDVFKVHL